MLTQLKVFDHSGAAEFASGYEKTLERSVEKAFWTIGKSLTREADRQILRTPKTGRLYYVKGRTRRHRASGPGESHANLTGTLRKSIGASVGGMYLEWGYGGGRIRPPIYAAAIELGSEKNKIKPRPTLQHSVNNELANTIEYLGSYTVRGFQ